MSAVERVPDVVNAWLHDRVVELGLRPLAPGANLFEQGVLDSAALAALVAYVELRAGCTIDFLLVDPDALDTAEGVAAELARAAG
jgi:hypothetical protein